MITPWVIAGGYIAQLGLKLLLARHYTITVRASEKSAKPHDQAVTVVQPILGGDPNLSSALATNLRNLPGATFLWLLDDGDKRAQDACLHAQAEVPQATVQVVVCAPAAQGENPKVVKLVRGLSEVTTERFVVLDDDTTLSASALHSLHAGLDQGAALATGLPRYRASHGRPSAWLAEFVNSAAALTYLPSLTFGQPFSIHGMCYAMKTEVARDLGLFDKIRHHLTDDLALAQQLNHRRMRLHQTVSPHDIATSLSGWRALHSILHRWFVFTRLLLQSASRARQCGIFLAYGLPPILLLALVPLATLSISGALALLSTLILRCAILLIANRQILGGETRHLPLASVLLELAQPWFLLLGTMNRTIRWRSRTIRVHRVDSFEYM